MGGGRSFPIKEDNYYMEIRVGKRVEGIKRKNRGSIKDERLN